MQTDFEPVLERQMHHFLNRAEGIWHMGQRDTVWTRVSTRGFERGLRLKHYGEIIHAKFLSDYPAIVDKVRVTLITDQTEVDKRIGVARKVYDERNRRVESMTDESVETFYSCLLCQSFAPNHVCIITPERLGLCGAYNWLDGKAAHEITETGPNQPVKKGRCLDPVYGRWQGVDEYVYTNSHKSVQGFNAYSLMHLPMTSCGCFEAICAYVPECNGVMVVNREYQGMTPVGMTFSTLAGSVGGGQQTPGFMGCGKAFVTSRKFLGAEGGHLRLVWMTKELKKLLASDLRRRFQEQGAPDLMDKIADEDVAVEVRAVRQYLEKVAHPALSMPDMSVIASFGAAGRSPTTSDAPSMPDRPKPEVAAPQEREAAPTAAEMTPTPVAPTAARHRPSLVSTIASFPVRREKAEVPVWTVKLGATKAEGGTRGRTYTIGGETCMPFHFWEGEMPHRPLVAMEVFDSVGAKYPEVLKRIYGDLLLRPAEMARVCVDTYGADLISVRLDGTHPEKGGRTPEEAAELVKEVLAAVDVPLIVTGHSHFESNNEVMKVVGKECAGENLLLNWVEQDNYRTIAGSALAYGHAVVSQSPIDVNIGKQMNILLTGMELKPERIVIDPMTGACGYGIEYTYSVMERIRLTGLGGDTMLAGPMIVSPGQECSKVKEYRAPESAFPAWGKLEERAALWELTTAVGLLYAGADVLIMYHPTAAVRLKKTILELMES